MSKTILVAIDGSPHAEKAIDLGCDLAGLYGGRVMLLHVLPTNPLPRGLSWLIKEERAAVAGRGTAPPDIRENRILMNLVGEREDDIRLANQLFADSLLLRAESLAKEKGIDDIGRRVASGDPADQIVRVAKEEAADIVVLGSRGLGNFEGLLTGSVSQKVSQLCPCSCLTVR